MFAANIANAAHVATRAVASAARAQLNSNIRPASQAIFANVGRQFSSINGMNVTLTFSSAPSTKEVFHTVNIAVQINKNPIEAFDSATANLSSNQIQSIALELENEWNPRNQDVVEPIMEARGGVEGQARVKAINADKSAVS